LGPFNAKYSDYDAIAQGLVLEALARAGADPDTLAAAAAAAAAAA
jgi:hypothetical protein